MESEYFCQHCYSELDEDDLEWDNDTPVCPYCANEIEL